MTTKEFDIKYKEKGGLRRLADMRASLCPQKVIAHHFGVSQERVRQWMLELFLEEYDPRPARREIAIQRMVDFYHNTSMQAFRRAFRGSAYYRKALKIIDNTIV